MSKVDTSRSPFLTLLLVVVGVVISGVILWQTAYWTRQVASDEIRNRSENTLTLVVSNLTAELERFRHLPRLISADPRLLAVVKNEASDTERLALNQELARINSVTGASDTYLMNRDGLTLAASNWDQTPTFIGRNFHFRPYFQLALQGKLGGYFALGTTSQARGYFFAYPVLEGTTVQGVIVVKITVETLEQEWRQANDQIMVLDDHGVVFLASDQGWQLHLLEPIRDEEMNALIASRRYANHEFGHLPLASIQRKPNGQIASLRLQTPQQGAKPSDYLVVQSNMRKEGWRVLLLADTSQLSSRVNAALAVVSLVLASLVLAIANLMQRRRRLAERMAMQEVNSRELERRVQQRTEALSDANKQLRNEVSERERAESELRDTQAGLVQATKLAALGQMSAGLSHELNQPLAAIRSYADNATAFIARGNTHTASENLQSITELVDRMNRIIKNLRTYAKDESISMRPVNLMTPLKDSIALLSERIGEEKVKVTLAGPSVSPIVKAGEVRLQQVFVNIISNALDAMRHCKDKALQIEVLEHSGTVSLCFTDNGPGVPDALHGQVFDPFYSTKSVGEGMGLGLSISYGIIDQFGGKIEVTNSPPSGAQFTVTLNKA